MQLIHMQILLFSLCCLLEEVLATCDGKLSGAIQLSTEPINFNTLLYLMIDLITFTCLHMYRCTGLWSLHVTKWSRESKGMLFNAHVYNLVHIVTCRHQ